MSVEAFMIWYRRIAVAVFTCVLVPVVFAGAYLAYDPQKAGAVARALASDPFELERPKCFGSAMLRSKALELFHMRVEGTYFDERCAEVALAQDLFIQGGKTHDSMMQITGLVAYRQISQAIDDASNFVIEAFKAPDNQRIRDFLSRKDCGWDFRDNGGSMEFALTCPRADTTIH